MINTNNTSTTSELTQSSYDHLVTDDYLKKLGRSTFIAAKLPEGDDYVAVIGNGTESTNLEAIYTLLLRNSDLFIATNNSKHLDNALELLKDQIENAESSYNSQ